ncbi:post-GPI attachment to proteins factor 2-like isoform X2 [Amphibalanus amphitrite]|uniref:post-GPI attachment to proteins factor 2-like isoform X2 n=1 Tax=Amphibalanus amphitrite TaxID=1232801 RepID=UPI001C902CB4|nr:post-GPI attachment to proteins factor 2-like isoform X2 [Amphibalanus amphitrite]
MALPGRRQYRYTPLSTDRSPAERGPRLRFRHLALSTVSLPLFGFLFCVGWSLKYNFESATSTHCKVANYLPSLSAAIGGFTVQRRVWKTVIALHALPRFLVGWFYLTFWQETLALTLSARALVQAANALYICENLGLLGLSFVTSSENFPFHKASFIVFLFCSELYMLITCWLSWLPRLYPVKRLDARSRRHKLLFFMLNFISLVFAMFFYARHNARCEPGVYTLFALSEYVVVLSNIAFHMTAYWDFHDKVLDLGEGLV